MSVRTARIDGAETSLLAADKQSARGRHQLKATLLWLIGAHGPVIDEDIAVRYGYLFRARPAEYPRRTDQALRTCRHELVDEGLVVAIDAEGRTRLGHRATRWALAPLKPPAAAE